MARRPKDLVPSSQTKPVGEINPTTDKTHKKSIIEPVSTFHPATVGPSNEQTGSRPNFEIGQLNIHAEDGSGGGSVYKEAPVPLNTMMSKATESNGHPLPSGIQQKFEQSLGTDLSGVRVHTGEQSTAAARSLQARAFTTGNDIHFFGNEYNPTSPDGQHLLAHEVAHTVQQQQTSPTPQAKKHVSSPGDAAEIEADRAADAMVAGKQTAVEPQSSSVTYRFPFGGSGQADPFGLNAPTSGSPFPMGPGVNPVNQPDPGIPTIGPFAPNVDKNGVPYDIPTLDYRAQDLSSVPPPRLDAAMPSAEIGDPGLIPGWKTIAPARQFKIGPFVTTEPAHEYIVSGSLHSRTAIEAWEAYKNDLIPAVRSTWDSDAKAKMDSFTQEAKGNPDLDKLVAESKSKYNFTIKTDAGTLSQQAESQQVTPGNTLGKVTGRVKEAGDALKQGAAASAVQPENTTVSGPLKRAVDALNAKREQRSGLMAELGGKSTELEASQTMLQAAEQELQEWKDKKAEEDEKKKDPQFETAKKIAGEIHPKLKELVATVEKYKEPLKTMKKIGESGLKAYSQGDPKAALDVAMGLVDLAKWQILQGKVAELGPAAANPRLTKISAAQKDIQAKIQGCAAISKQIESALKDEKRLYDEVAKQLETNWKGANPEQGKIAADAMRAIPTVDRLVRVLKEMQAALPKLPSASTRASQGYALATQGVNAPGAADLQKVAGWISSSPQVLGAEVAKWEGIRTQLESVAAAVGVE